MAAGERPARAGGEPARADDRDAGPDRALADDQRSVALDQGRVADGHAGHVGDGVFRAGRPQAQGDPQVSCSHRQRVPAGVDARQPVPLTGRIIGHDDPHPPRSPGGPARPRRSDLRRLPDGIAAGTCHRCRRGVPRPAGPGPPRERPTGSQRPLDVPDRRPGRGPRGAGGRPGSVRRRPPAARPAWTRHRSSRPTPRRSSAGWSGSSATTWATPSNGCRPSPRPTRTCRRCASPCTTGSSPGIDGPGTPGWAAGPSTVTRGGSRAAWMTSTRDCSRPAPGRAPGAARRPVERLTFRSSLEPRRRTRRGVERVRAHIAARRDLPGEPDPPARDARSTATRGRSIAGSGPATRRCSRPTSTSARRR